MQILTLHATTGLQTKLEANGQKMTFWASVAPTGAPLGTMDSPNCQILMQILSLYATMGLQTKFEANQVKNDILGILGPP